MPGITIPPPSVIFEIEYDFYMMAQDKYSNGPGSGTNNSLSGAYENVEQDVSAHRNAVTPMIRKAILVHTPVSSGRLNSSIEAFMFTRPGPIQSLTWTIWQDPTYDVISQIYYPGAWVEIEEYMPSYYSSVFVCYSNPSKMFGLEYAMAVEVGSQPHIAPVQRLGEWTYQNWTAKSGIYDEDGDFASFDIGAGYRLQAKIKSRGTPAIGMFWNGYLLASSDIIFASSDILDFKYWSISRSEYHLADVII